MEFTLVPATKQRTWGEAGRLSAHMVSVCEEKILIEIHLFYIVQGGFVTFSCLHKDLSCLCVFKNGQKLPKILESNSRTLKNVTIVNSRLQVYNINDR